MASRNKRPVSAQDLYQIQLISGTRISPDGRYVVYSLQRVDPKTEKKYNNLWIVPTDGGAPRQFTYGDQSDTLPRWSPDGSQIAFLSNRLDKDKPAQLFLIPFSGGEARPLNEIEGEIGEYSWSPDGKKLLCQVRKNDPEAVEREKDEQKRKLGVVVRSYDRLFYKLDGYGYLPLERWHIWTVDTHTGKGKQLTDHPVWDEFSPAWSVDGKFIAYLSNVTEAPDSYPERVDLFVMPSRGGEARKINTPFGEKSSPSFSPDGKWIAYYAQEGEGLDYKNTGLWTVPADGSAPPCNLTEEYDLHVSSWTINDLGSPEVMPPTWSNDSRTIYFPAVFHGSSLLHSIDLNGKNLQTVIGEGGVVGSFSFDKKQKHLAYFYGKIDDPGQVVLRMVDSGRERTLTQVNASLLKEWDLGQIEEVWFKGVDGNDLQGWIMKPPGFNPTRKYPSILEIHGGPLTQYGKFFMHEFYFLAANGFVVYFTNPRGGRGYGETHAGAIHRNWGSVDYSDLMTWTDYVASLPYIDTTHMGVTGGSYGGYMTVWVIGHTSRYKAAVTQRCVSNLISMWGSSDFNWSFQRTFAENPPFDDLEKFWEQSPIKYIGKATTPTLVIHNEMDLRCPIEQGEQVFVALKRLGVDTEMVRFPDEFHGLSRTGRTDRRIARLNNILRWFNKYLKE